MTTQFLSVAVARGLKVGSMSQIEREAMLVAQYVGLRKHTGNVGNSLWAEVAEVALTIELDNTISSELKDDDGKIRTHRETDFTGCLAALDAHIAALQGENGFRKQATLILAERAGYARAFPSKTQKDGTVITSQTAMVSAMLKGTTQCYKIIRSAWKNDVRIDTGERRTDGSAIPPSANKLKAAVSKAIQAATPETPKDAAIRTIGVFASNWQASIEPGTEADVATIAAALNDAILFASTGKLGCSLSDLFAGVMDVVDEAAAKIRAEKEDEAAQAGEPLADIPQDEPQEQVVNA
jgi:hypothetical protein